LKPNRIWKNILFIGLQSLLVLFIIEWIYRGSIGGTIFWLYENSKPSVYNLIFLFVLFLGLRIFKLKPYLIISFIISTILLLLSFASHEKQGIRGEPILPNDLLLGSEAKKMLEYFDTGLILSVIIYICIVVTFVIFLWKFSIKDELGFKKRIPLFLFLITFIILFQMEYTTGGSKFKDVFNIEYNSRDQKFSYERNGLIAGFLMNLRYLGFDTSIGYNQKKINNTVKNIKFETVESDENPDVIMIMSEAFWDPTIMEDLVINKDPLPNFHQLIKDYTSGSLTVPVFGGSTVSTEFEVLTGMSTQFLPPGIVPYVQYVNKPVPALPYLFKESGYDVTGIHSYHHWFYERSTAYKYLGFDEFISLEYFDNPKYTATFIHDSSMNEEILKKLDSNQNPKFIYAVTTQNHGPYSMDPKIDYSDWEIGLKSGGALSKESESILKTYLHNLEEIDGELNKLLEEIQKRNRKTIVVFFGDHLPLLGDDYQVYREANYYQEINNYEEYLKMYTTPVLVWDNFTNERRDVDLGSSFLGAYTLNAAGVKGNSITNYLNQIYSEQSLVRIPREDYWKSEKLNEDIIDNLKLLQYDALSGKQWGINKEELKISDNYRIGYTDPKINSVSEETLESKKVLKVYGQGFTGRSEVYINDKLVNKITGNPQELILPFSARYKKNIDIEVRVVDSYGNVLSKSNTYQYPIND
jgi:phosphoglycerol transferase MdoB-like AlkP superfamily enzyme